MLSYAPRLLKLVAFNTDILSVGEDVAALGYKYVALKLFVIAAGVVNRAAVVVVGDGDNVAVAHREPVLEERVVVLRQIHSVCVLKSLSRVCRCVGDFCNGAVNNRRGEVGICAEIADGDAV